MDETDAHPASNGPRTRQWRRAPTVAVVVAVLAQAGVVLMTVVMGLMWDGWTYSAAVLQAVLFGVGVLVLGLRRRWLTLAVPVTSFALSVALQALFVKVEAAAACTPDMRRSAGQLTALPGTRVDLHGEPADGCIARFSVPASANESVTSHYRREFTRNGWEVTTQESGLLQGTKNGIVMDVEVDGGEGVVVVVVVVREVERPSDR